MGAARGEDVIMVALLVSTRNQRAFFARQAMGAARGEDRQRFRGWGIWQRLFVVSGLWYREDFAKVKPHTKSTLQLCKINCQLCSEPQWLGPPGSSFSW